MSIYIPFTYIIGWSQHNKFYYGCKYAQGCQPADLWTTYFTSSIKVSEFRKEFGEPDIIKIHRTFVDKDSCVLFEHQYLTKIDAKNNILFLNESNGNKDYNGSGADWTTSSFNRAKKTWLDNYGVDNPSKSEEIKQKKKDTCLENWGYENASQSPEIKEQKRKTFLERYGVDSPGKIEEGIEKRKQTCLEKYGPEHYNKSEEVKEKRKQTNLENWGYESHNQSPIIKGKKKDTCLENWGYEFASQSPVIKEKTKQNCLEKYGVDHISKLEKICKYCGEFKTVAHENQCPLKPNKTKKDMSSRLNYYEVTSPEGSIFQVRGKKGLNDFAKEHNIKHRWTFVHELRCEGWIIQKLCFFGD